MKKIILLAVAVFFSVCFYAQIEDDVYYVPKKREKSSSVNHNRDTQNGGYASNRATSQKNNYDNSPIFEQRRELNLSNLENGVYEVRVENNLIYSLYNEFDDITNVYDLADGYYTIYVDDNEIVIKRKPLLYSDSYYGTGWNSYPFYNYYNNYYWQPYYSYYSPYWYSGWHSYNYWWYDYGYYGYNNWNSSSYYSYDHPYNSNYNSRYFENARNSRYFDAVNFNNRISSNNRDNTVVRNDTYQNRNTYRTPQDNNRRVENSSQNSITIVDNRQPTISNERRISRGNEDNSNNRITTDSRTSSSQTNRDRRSDYTSQDGSSRSSSSRSSTYSTTSPSSSRSSDSSSSSSSSSGGGENRRR